MNVERNWFKIACEFERNLKPGDRVEARWTNCHREYMARAEVVRVNGKSVRVRLLDELRDGDKLRYEIGREFSLPLVLAFERHSARNCVVALEDPDKVGPKYRRGENIPGRGKVTRIFVNIAGYDYDCEAEAVA